MNNSLLCVMLSLLLSRYCYNNSRGIDSIHYVLKRKGKVKITITLNIRIMDIAIVKKETEIIKNKIQ